ncbi:RNHCP domain-containing protein [Protofrankia symbiont of Coriaria ruscifolia]|uniref:RNHCP domain-containing protein n=1 Tax=Protofrankia symbiont of Coriaria ruscifolia TaxID=1306542 RepID=UPI001041A572|nr:RNHCP domain-containing protein [Protofrankia symbiont of Coriaria ruscifolia]
MTRRFTRTAEDFQCLACGTPVHGDGYTNHCPRCLWSRHVDVNPGDRAADCAGPMRPVAVEVRAGRTVVVHRCKSCGHQRRNRTSPADDIEAIMKLSAEGGVHAGSTPCRAPEGGRRRISRYRGRAEPDEGPGRRNRMNRNDPGPAG